MALICLAQVRQADPFMVICRKTTKVRKRINCSVLLFNLRVVLDLVKTLNRQIQQELQISSLIYLALEAKVAICLGLLVHRKEGQFLVDLDRLRWLLAVCLEHKPLEARKLACRDKPRCCRSKKAAKTRPKRPTRLLVILKVRQRSL